MILLETHYRLCTRVFANKKRHAKTLCYYIILLYKIDSIYDIYIAVLVNMVSLRYFILK